jgi:hypothetical protein
MGEKTNKWSREQGFFAANSADIFTVVIVILCGVIFVLLMLTQWNMADLVKDYFNDQASSRPAEPPRQPDIPSKPGETGMFLYPDKPAQSPKKQ